MELEKGLETLGLRWRVCTWMEIQNVMTCGFFVAFGFFAPLGAEQMPREDAVEVVAVGEGLCLHNLFQSNMVIQRDKPVAIWGWAEPAEEVTVILAGKKEVAKADLENRVTKHHQWVERMTKEAKDSEVIQRMICSVLAD